MPQELKIMLYKFDELDERIQKSHIECMMTNIIRNHISDIHYVIQHHLTSLGANIETSIGEHPFFRITHIDLHEAKAIMSINVASCARFIGSNKFRNSNKTITFSFEWSEDGVRKQHNAMGPHKQIANAVLEKINLAYNLNFTTRQKLEAEERERYSRLQYLEDGTVFETQRILRALARMV